MGTNADFCSELNKLKKELLIEIIVTKRIPSGVSLSNELRELISESKDEVFSDCSGENSRHNLSTDIRIVQLKSQLKILETELKCARAVMNSLERTIGDKEEIVNLLRQQNTNLIAEASRSDVAKLELKSPSARSHQDSPEDIVTPVPTAAKGKVTDQNRPRSFKAMQPNRGKYAAIVGNGTESTTPGKPAFSSAVRKAWLYVGRAERDTTCRQVLDHLQKSFPGQQFEIDPLPVRDDAKSIAFKLGADIGLIDQLNKPDVWPNGILVKRYRFFRKHSEVPE